MSKLLAVISPAKLLDDQTHHPELNCTQPLFMSEAESLVAKLKKVSAAKLSSMMAISKALGEENKKRYLNWETPFTHHNAHPALLMFRGEVYRGLNADTFNQKQLQFANDNVRILSGLYGILRPLDLVMPYRLMMGTPFSPSAKQKNLYAFWGNKIAASLQSDIDPKGILVNLSSSEYFKSVDTKTLNREVIQIEFKEKKADKYVITGTYAKLARGRYARFFIENKITKRADLKAFDVDGYGFNEKLSDENSLIFTRG